MVFAIRKATAKKQAKTKPKQTTVMVTGLPYVHVLLLGVTRFHVLQVMPWLLTVLELNRV